MNSDMALPLLFGLIVALFVGGHLWLYVRRRLIPRLRSANWRRLGRRLAWVAPLPAIAYGLSWLVSEGLVPQSVTDSWEHLSLSTVAVYVLAVFIWFARKRYLQHCLSNNQRAQTRKANAREANRRAQLDADQLRRDNARARCETSYHRHAADISTRFPRTNFDEFLSRHMGNERAPDVVERRAEELLALIRDHVNKVQPPPKHTPTIDGILSGFEVRKAKVEEAGLDPNDMEKLLIDIEIQRAEAMRKAVLEDAS